MIKLATIWLVWPDNCLLTIAEWREYEYSGFWIIMVLTMALNPCWGSFTVRALSCPQPHYLLSLELADLVRLVPLLVKVICMLSGLQPFFAGLCLSRDCQSQLPSLSPLRLALESLQNSGGDGWLLCNSKGCRHCAFLFPFVFVSTKKIILVLCMSSKY